VYFPAVAPPLAKAGKAVPVDAKSPPAATTSVFSINARRLLVTAVISTTAAVDDDDDDEKEGRVKAVHVVATTSRQHAKYDTNFMVLSQECVDAIRDGLLLRQ
jgi:hypothetical protein